MGTRQPRLFSIAILRADRQAHRAYILTQISDASSFPIYARGNAIQILRFTVRTVAENAPVGWLDVEHEGYFSHTISDQSGLVTCVVTNGEYPSNVAFSVAAAAQRDFLAAHPSDWQQLNADATPELTFPNLRGLFDGARDPATATQITRIQTNLEETKRVLVQTMEALMQRGASLEDAAKKS